MKRVECNNSPRTFQSIYFIHLSKYSDKILEEMNSSSISKKLSNRRYSRNHSHKHESPGEKKLKLLNYQTTNYIRQMK